MECLFISNLQENTSEFVLTESESKHTKSLRLGIDDDILVTNGIGMTALCRLTGLSKNGNTVKCIEFYHNLNELECEITLATGILENHDRFEILIEKAVELGVKEIVPLITQRSSDKPVRYERATAKIIAALKQSKRSIMPEFSEAVQLSFLYDNFNLWDKVILADENGSNSINISGAKKILILCGPEGGFSDEELSIIDKADNLQKIKLAGSRLRSETAAIAALSVVVFNI